MFFATRVLDAPTIEAEGWTEAILSLDQETMAATLLAAGVDLPEAKRREGLKAPTTVVVARLADDCLAGYIEFCNDRKAEETVYLSSLQLKGEHRTGRPLAILLVECARELRSRPFTRLRSGVHHTNRAAVRLYERLGFQLRERPGNSVMWEVSAGKHILDSTLLHRIERFVAGGYNRTP